MVRVKDQFGGVYRRCRCRKEGIRDEDCPHPWYYRVRHGGEQIRRSVGPGPEGKKIAWQKVYELRGALMREGHLGVRTVGRATMEKFWPILEPERVRTLSPTAYRAFRYRYQVAERFFREPMSEVSTPRVREFFNSLGDVKPSTRNRYLDTLSIAFQSALDAGYAAFNPVEGLKREREPRIRPPRVTPAEVDAIVARAPECARTPIRLCYLMGLRRAEAADLSARSIDLDRRIAIFRGKGSKVRAVPIPPEAIDLIGAAMNRPTPLTGDAPLFPELGGPEGLSRAFKSAWKKSGLPRITLHHLRAAFITGLLEDGGASLTEARDLAGHGSISVTDRYAAYARTDRMRDAVEKFARRDGANDQANPDASAPDRKERTA